MDEQRPLEICINSHGPVVSVFETFGSNREIEKIAGTDSLTVAIKGPGLDRTMKPHQGDIGAVGGASNAEISKFTGLVSWRNGN